MVSHQYYPSPYPANIYPPPQQEAPATNLPALYHSLDEQVKHIEHRLLVGAVVMIQQELTVHMILSSNASWTVAIRKFLVIVFGTEIMYRGEVKEKFYSAATELSKVEYHQRFVQCKLDLILFVPHYRPHTD